MTYEYLLWMSITHNINLNPLLNLLITCISARSARQILSIKGECTFLLLNFLMIGLCNSSINSLLGSFFYQKIYKPNQQMFVYLNL